jgi:hypothetical protein
MFKLSRRSVALLLSLSAYVMAQHTSLVKSRELDYFPIPDEAQGAFCSAITGWYDRCIVPLTMALSATEPNYRVLMNRSLSISFSVTRILTLGGVL